MQLAPTLDQLQIAADHTQRFLQIVGGDHQRHPHVVEALEQAHDLQGELRIQVARGLIGDQQGRTTDDRPGDADALLLAAGQRLGHLFLPAQETHLIECRAHAPADLPRAGARDDQRQGHVVEYVAIEQQLVILEDHADVAPVTGYATPPHLREILVVHDDAPAGGTLDQRDQLQERALACAGMARDEDHLAIVHVQRESLQRVVTAVALGDILQVNHRAASPPRSRSASTNSSASKGCRSSSPSPTPM